MIDISNFEQYISSISYDLDDDLEEIYGEAVKNHVPVIRRASIDLLRLILKMKNPNSVLELGTGVGFSGSFIVRATNAHLTTIERNDKRIAKSKENFKKLAVQDKVNLIEGDIVEVIDEIKDKFDVIFLDSAKGSYKELLPKLVRLLNSRGILVTDNILQNGDILCPRSLINQRDRTTYDRMREFVYKLYHTKELTTTVIPGGDGMAVSILNE